MPKHPGPLGQVDPRSRLAPIAAHGGSVSAARHGDAGHQQLALLRERRRRA